MQEGLTRTYITLADGSTQEVRLFASADLQRSIDTALAGVTDGSATIHLEANPGGYNAAIAAKLNGHWSIAAAYNRGDWGWAAGTTVKFSWR